MIRTPLPSFLTRFSATAALRHRDFRLYWMGLVSSVTGYMMVVSFSLNWLIFDLTKQPIYLGYVGLTLAIPSIALNLFGGAFADRLSLKAMIGVCQTSTACVVLVLMVLTVRGLVEPWHVLVTAFLVGAVQAFDSPARQSILPRLVPREDIPSAVAMHNFAWQGMGIVAPSLAGILVATVGISATLSVGAGTFIFMAAIVQTIRIPVLDRQRRNVLREIGDGFSFVRSHRTFALLLGTSYYNGFFGMAIAFFMMPIFASEEMLNVGPKGMGFMLAAFGCGAVVGTIITGSVRESYRQGQLIVLGMTVSGSFFALFALSPWFLLSVPLLFVAGVGNSLALVSIMGSLQMLIPDNLRGRIMGFFSMTFSMPALGAIVLTSIADTINPRFAVALGGAFLISFIWIIAFRSSRLRGLGSEVRLAAAERQRP